MKKLILAGILTTVSSLAIAENFGVGIDYVYDVPASAGGTRLNGYAGKYSVFTPKVSVTTVSGQYNRFGLGTDIDVINYGPFSLAATVTGSFQDTSYTQDVIFQKKNIYYNVFERFDSGWGVAGGVKANYNVAKNIDFNVTWEQFNGETNINRYNGNIFSSGLAYRF